MSRGVVVLSPGNYKLLLVFSVCSVSFTGQSFSNVVQR